MVWTWCWIPMQIPLLKFFFDYATVIVYFLRKSKQTIDIFSSLLMPTTLGKRLLVAEIKSMQRDDLKIKFKYTLVVLKNHASTIC